jgi:uncharacterized protein YjbI with pentapeptide repeats
MSNVKPPVLAKTLPDAQLDALDGAELEGLRIESCELAKARASQVRFEGVALVGGTMSESHVDALSWMDVRCERLDVSLAEWPRANLTRIELLACRATGLKLVDARIEDARFVDCHLDYAIFSGARLRRVVFERCRFRDADFGGADLTGTVFSGCELASVEFAGAKLDGADIRTSTVHDVRVTARDVRGLVVTRDQAATLAQLLGLVVHD